MLPHGADDVEGENNAAELARAQGEAVSGVPVAMCHQRPGHLSVAALGRMHMGCADEKSNRRGLVLGSFGRCF